MQDFLHQELEVGDEVVIAINHGVNAGADLSTGVVIGFTPKMVRVDKTLRHAGEPQRGVKLIAPYKVVKVGGIKHE